MKEQLDKRENNLLDRIKGRKRAGKLLGGAFGGIGGAGLRFMIAALQKNRENARQRQRIGAFRSVPEQLGRRQY